MLRVLILLFLSLIINSYAAVYIFPPDYDDIKSTVQNGNSTVTITESTTNLSTNTYSIRTVYESSVNTRLKCASVPKIACSTGNIDVHASITSYKLSENVDATTAIARQILAQSIFAEELTNTFNICAIVYSDNGNVFFVQHDESVHSNTDDIYQRSADSYITISVKQVCK